MASRFRPKAVRVLAGVAVAAAAAALVGRLAFPGRRHVARAAP
jgi:hypothetical protein